MGRWLAFAGLSGLIAIAVGAFGTHVLAGRIPPTSVSWIATASGYQMVHSLALLGVAILTRDRAGRSATVELAGWCFVAGIVLFCGSLYVLALTGAGPVAWLTPVGGVALMVGWAALARQGFVLWRES
jgi:uncharacterized membrane protein YgdD (TMEM256/DUF423 family)